MHAYYINIFFIQEQKNFILLNRWKLLQKVKEMQ